MKLSIQNAATAVALALSTYSMKSTYEDVSIDTPAVVVQNKSKPAELGTNDETSWTKIRDLLEYIQRFESTGAAKSQGVLSAYEVVHGGIAAVDRPSVVLTRMTVAEVLAWQETIDSLYKSEAAGAYQVMEDTLRGLVETGQIDPEAVFNEATQDNVAELLMERRGLSQFIAGDITAEEFADNLAREWASFPVMRDQKGASRHVKRGQSYYAGDGLNKAHADPDEFLNMVKGIVMVPAASPEGTKVVNADVPEEVQSQPVRSEVRANATTAGTIALGATKLIDSQITIDGQIDLTNYHAWNITTKAKYEFETQTYKIGGSATYKRDNLSYSFSGTHDSDDDTEFKAEVKYRF